VAAAMRCRYTDHHRDGVAGVLLVHDKVFFVADADATFTDEEHNATLSAMGYAFCDVIGSAEVIDLIRRDRVAGEVGAEAVA
jgi:hypothetical protein